MRLKFLTLLFFFSGLGLLLAWPALVGKQPTGKRELARYAQRFGTYGSATMLCFLGAAISAAFVARQTREEYRQKLRDNMRGLVEGTLEDHRTKKSEESHDA